MTKKVYLAVDLGAESGRVMAGIWNGKKLQLEEINRFLIAKDRSFIDWSWDARRAIQNPWH